MRRVRLFQKKTKIYVLIYLVIDENDQGETADNNTLFSEIQLSGDVEASGSSETILDRNFRLSRLRRLTTVDRRISSSLSTRSDSIVYI
jgi:hypothetical protein